jgi:pimeloyl-ACP methyl ester carboxylesterase
VIILDAQRNIHDILSAEIAMLNLGSMRRRTRLAADDHRWIVIGTSSFAQHLLFWKVMAGQPVSSCTMDVSTDWVLGALEHVAWSYRIPRHDLAASYRAGASLGPRLSDSWVIWDCSLLGSARDRQPLELTDVTEKQVDDGRELARWVLASVSDPSAQASVSIVIVIPEGQREEDTEDQPGQPHRGSPEHECLQLYRERSLHPQIVRLPHLLGPSGVLTPLPDRGPISQTAQRAVVQLHQEAGCLNFMPIDLAIDAVLEWRQSESGNDHDYTVKGVPLAISDLTKGAYQSPSSVGKDRTLQEERREGLGLIPAVGKQLAFEQRICDQGSDRNLWRRSLVQADDGATLYTYSAGGCGPWLLMLNAHGLDIELLTPMARYLSEDFRLLAFQWRDIPAWRTDADAPVSLERHVHDIDAVLRHHGVVSPHVLGWCSGADIAINWVARGGRARTLCLLNGSFGYSGAKVSKFGELMLPILRRVVVRPERAVSYAKQLSDTANPPDMETAWEQFHLSRPYRDPGDLIAYAQFQMQLHSRRDPLPTIPSSLPTLVITHPGDVMAAPENSRFVAAQLNAPCVELDVGEHHNLYTHPGAVVGVMRRLLSSSPMESSTLAAGMP